LEEGSRKARIGSVLSRGVLPALQQCLAHQSSSIGVSN
jgi:hypothetical protein